MVDILRRWTVRNVSAMGRAPSCISGQYWVVPSFCTLLRSLRDFLGTIRFKVSRIYVLTNFADALPSVVADRCRGILDLPIGWTWIAHGRRAWDRNDAVDGGDVLRDTLRSSLCWAVGWAILPDAMNQTDIT